MPGGAAETAALARGGRTSFLGYVLRLAARFPFLFIAGRLYGAEALGRFAYATMVVELVAMLATLGLKRGLAEDMAVRGAELPTARRPKPMRFTMLCWSPSSPR